MSRLLAGLVTLAAIIGMAAPVSAQTIGVVLMLRGPSPAMTRDKFEMARP
jgi:hypothetical protein